MKESKRILQRHGAAEAATYMAMQPAKYRETQEYKTVVEMVADAAACEALDQKLAETDDPDTQVRAAQAALRERPESADLKKRLAMVRSRLEEIGAIAEEARVLEASQNMAPPWPNCSNYGRLSAVSGPRTGDPAAATAPGAGRTSSAAEGRRRCSSRSDAPKHRPGSSPVRERAWSNSDHGPRPESENAHRSGSYGASHADGSRRARDAPAGSGRNLRRRSAASRQILTGSPKMWLVGAAVLVVMVGLVLLYVLVRH